jgi:hypothetical protein
MILFLTVVGMCVLVDAQQANQKSATRHMSETTGVGMAINEGAGFAAPLI